MADETDLVRQHAKRLAQISPHSISARVIERYGWPLPPMAGAEEPPADPPTDDPRPTADPEPDPSPAADDPRPADEPFDAKRARATIDRQRESEAAALERAKKAEAKLKEIEDAGKSDAERRDEKLSTTEKENDSLKSENARLKVALELRLTASQAKRLVGNTEEELKADAEELLASFGGKKESDDGRRRRPRENLRPGTVPDAEAEEMDPAKLAADLPSYA